VGKKFHFCGREEEEEVLEYGLPLVPPFFAHDRLAFYVHDLPVVLPVLHAGTEGLSLEIGDLDHDPDDPALFLCRLQVGTSTRDMSSAVIRPEKRNPSTRPSLSGSTSIMGVSFAGNVIIVPPGEPGEVSGVVFPHGEPDRADGRS
jgi:hypothetical protein